MPVQIVLHVNGQLHRVEVDPDTPLLYVLRNGLGLKGPKYGCGLETCNACKVLIDGADVPSCKIPVKNVQGLEITTIEGLAADDDLHPLQQALLEEQAAQCGYCTAGMIIAAQGLLNRVRYPTDDEIREALAGNLCRCGSYDRIRRAIKLRIAQPVEDPVYEIKETETLQHVEPIFELPTSLQQTPELDAWIRIDDANTITIFTGKVELGQGVKTAVAQIAAEELGVSVTRIQVVTADTGQTPDEGLTVSSMSMETSGNAIRFAAAEAHYILLSLAFEQLEAATPALQLEVVDGTITDPAIGKQVTYWELMGGRRFGRQVTGRIQPKHADAYQVVGQPEKRIDLLNKVTGSASFVHDMDLPGMVHARVVRPPNYHARLISVDEGTVRQMPGVIKVIRDGSFLAVISEREEQAIWAMDALRENAVWEHGTTLPSQLNLYDHLLNQPAQSALVVDGALIDDPIPSVHAPTEAVQTLTAAYLRPYHMHASLGPSAAAAQWADGQLTVWSHTQGVYYLQAAIARVLQVDTSVVRVIHVEGAGCYGHNGADDAALDAALLARAVPERPVLLKWMRADEHGWEPYGSAMAMQMQGSLDAEGTVIDWNHDVWSYSHSTRPSGHAEGSGLLAAWHVANPFAPPQPRLVKGPHFGSHRNADPKYAFPHKRIVKHFTPNSPLRVSALRSLGAYANVFAIESFMDELAVAAGIDPVVFRLRHLTDDRSKAVIKAAADKANWQPRSRPSGQGHGRGIAFAQYKNRQSYASVVVDVHIDQDNGTIHLKRVVIAADAGQIVNPDGLSNQLEGGFVQAASWTLLEQVSFDETGITSLDWDTYPILRFSESPVIETVLLNRPGMPFLGSGEAAQNPTPAAIANAVFDAIGIRLRQIPFTPERVKAALDNLM